MSLKVIKYRDLLREENIAAIKKVVHSGGVIIYPTDTLYGMGGHFFSLKAMETIDRIKNRSDAPYSAATPGMDMIRTLVDSIPPVFEQLYEQLLPGKFTFLFNASSTIPKELLKGGGKIGIRVPNTPKLLKLLKILNVPFISTSVNRSGESPLNDPGAIARAFSGSASILVDAGSMPPSKGSTILDITSTPVKCIRKGDDFEKLVGLVELAV